MIEFKRVNGMNQIDHHVSVAERARRIRCHALPTLHDQICRVDHP